MRSLRLVVPLSLAALLLTACGEESTVTAPAAPGSAKPSASPSPSGPSDEVIRELIEDSWEVDAKANLRDLATAEETFLTDTNSYGTIKQIEASGNPIGVNPGITLKVVSFDGADTYCLSAKHERADTTFFYDSAKGGLLREGETGCTEVKGVPGDEKSAPYTPADEKADEEEARSIFAEGGAGAAPEGEDENGADPSSPEALLESSLTNVATAMETYLTDNNVYGSFAEMRAKGVTEFMIAPGVSVTIVSYDGAASYCLKAEGEAGVRFFDAAAGGQQPEGATGCPVAKTGKPGGTEKG